ncbi:MAG: hypothetical protein ABH812_01385 [bacterium]
MLEITIITLLFFSTVVLGKIILNGDTKDDKYQKIFGGIVVFVIALISENPWAISLSIFVGGLIIASEDFMKFLAAVMRTRGDKVADTVDALLARASDEEVDEKREQEVADIEIEVESAGREEKRTINTTNERVLERAHKIKWVEQRLMPILQNELGDNFEPHMRISSNTSNEKPLIVDGVIRRKNRKIGLVVEIKYITGRSFENLKYLIYRYKQRLRKLGIKGRILMVVASEEMTREAAQAMYNENKNAANLMFFKVSEKGLEEVEYDKNSV